MARDPGGPDVAPYAAAARAENFADLPPAFIAVGTLDLFVGENLAYAQRLLHAGVAPELVVYPGVYHGFDTFVPEAVIAKRFQVDAWAALRRALHS